MNEPGYEQLAEVLEDAFRQAAHGKGKERHANDLPFHEQRMLGISRLLDNDAGMAYQACKKLTEARALPHEACERELLGAIVYIAGMVIFHRERAGMIGDIHAGLADAYAGRVTPLSEVKARFEDAPSILEPVDLAELMTEEREQRMDVIGQNGNDGEHYDAPEVCQMPKGVNWSSAPSWATDLGRIGIARILVWYNAERYQYLGDGQGYEFREEGEISCRRLRSEVEHIASRPKKQPIKKHVCLACGGGHALHKCAGGHRG